MSVITSWGATPNRLRIALKFVAGSGQDGVTINAIQETLLPGLWLEPRRRTSPREAAPSVRK